MEGSTSVFQQHPLLGVGPRLQDLYIDYGGLKNAHNGYLVALIELGLFGFLTLMSFLAIRVYKILGPARAGNKVAQVGFCLWAGYAFIGMFDSRLINAGNRTSLLVWFFLLMPMDTTRQTKSRRTFQADVAVPDQESVKGNRSSSEGHVGRSTADPR
jgi:O-antigen ligase